MRKLNIVMVSAHACIRCQKMALPLISDGHNVHMVAQKIPSFWESYKTFSVYHDAGQLISTIEQFEKAGNVDLYHCHNEPSWFVTVLKERTKRPVLLDVHDTFLTRLTDDEEINLKNAGFNACRVMTEERTNFQIADGLLFVSPKVRDLTCKEFKLNQPALVMPQYLPEFLYKYNFGRWQGGLVYEGKVTLPNEVVEHGRSLGFDYCDYTKVAADCARIGMDFHLYAARKDPAFMSYFKTAFVHEPVAYKELMTNLSAHDWGLVGNTIDSYQWQTTLANKFFEYIAAGVPVVSINAAECSKLIDQYNVGITVESIDELAARWGEAREKRDSLIKVRQELSMERHLKELTDFYESFL